MLTVRKNKISLQLAKRPGCVLYDFDRRRVSAPLTADDESGDHCDDRALRGRDVQQVVGIVEVINDVLEQERRLYAEDLKETAMTSSHQHHLLRLQIRCNEAEM